MHSSVVIRGLNWWEQIHVFARPMETGRCHNQPVKVGFIPPLWKDHYFICLSLSGIKKYTPYQHGYNNRKYHGYNDRKDYGYDRKDYGYAG